MSTKAPRVALTGDTYLWSVAVKSCPPYNLSSPGLWTPLRGLARHNIRPDLLLILEITQEYGDESKAGGKASLYSCRLTEMGLRPLVLAALAPAIQPSLSAKRLPACELKLIALSYMSSAGEATALLHYIYGYCRAGESD